MGFIDRPQRVWWRMAMFQIHLWGGVVLCLYMLVIGVTGSILVFESELEHVAYPQLWRATDSQAGKQAAELPAVTETVRKEYPGYKITAAYLPDKPGDNFEVFVHEGKTFRYVFLDANTGRIVGAINPDRSWLIWIIDLHFRLLGGRVGEIINGIGAGCLLLLCATGALVWWAGLKHWTRGLKVNLHRSWRRVNFDLHSAVGFWTLLVLSMWAFTGVYFVWPKPIESFVNHFSSIASANPPVFVVPPRGDGPWVDLHRMIEQAQQSSPNARFAGAFFPGSDKSALTLLMARGAARNFSQMDYVYFDPATGRQLALWHRGINTTWGGSFIFWLSPLHFGYDWGLAIKILWATLGCALPLLAITGVLMYWNRSLSKKWKRLSWAESQ
ncbi:PepSY domain-containing protein [Granulicella mallensis]|uniref:Putative iron-regulated membrane protein n=1 Tax=Granulicella mallensis TaxID=940614 RepID=A0A7W7ZN63_9BACT|nr:PepSY-associated TM helix domain-containing protein [Granulicella mallensis]MBB5062276.1 putative iron-regulated membrane protein [Granulicella mallensis]